MEAVLQDVRTILTAGNGTMHYKHGQLDDIWSDKAIEATFIRVSHIKGRIIGITTKPQPVKHFYKQ